MKETKRSLHEAPPAPGATARRLPVGRPETRDPRDLDEHALSRRLFPGGLGSDGEQHEMAESLSLIQRSPILITGTGCGSAPPDVVLDGRRTRRAAIKAGLREVEVRVYDDLSDDEQAEIIVHANLAAGLARRMNEEQKAALENFLLLTVGKRQGRRADTSSAGQGSARRGEWPALVADELRAIDPANDATPNAIRERHLLYYSPVSPLSLQARVTEGRVSRKAAVGLVREALRAPEVAEVLKGAAVAELPADQLATHPAIVEAKARVFSEVDALLRGGKTPRLKRPKATPLKQAEGVLTGGVCELDNFLGRRVKIEVHAEEFVITDEGEADSDASIYRPDDPTTRSTWAIDVAAAVDHLPGDVRSQVIVANLERLDPVRCPTCAGTKWRDTGGCPTCDPLVDLHRIRDDIERRALEAKYAELLEAGRHGDSCQRTEADRQKSARDLALRWLDTQVLGRTPSAGPCNTPLKQEIRDAQQAAIEADPRVGEGWVVVDLRYPRERIRIVAPMGEVSVVLWTRLSDARREATGPGIVVDGELGSVRLGVRGSDAIWHSRRALRNIVYAAVMRKLGRRPKSFKWWVDGALP